MDENIKLQLQSALYTFLATFITAVGTLIASGAQIEWTWAFWGSVLLVGVRAGIKVLFQKYAPEALGGVPKKG